MAFNTWDGSRKFLLILNFPKRFSCHLMLKQTDFQYLLSSICQLFPFESGESCSDSIFLVTIINSCTGEVSQIYQLFNARSVSVPSCALRVCNWQLQVALQLVSIKITNRIKILGKILSVKCIQTFTNDGQFTNRFLSRSRNEILSISKSESQKIVGS